MSGRVYERKFDWDEARRRHKQGEAATSIAASLGVSDTAVQRVVNPRTMARMEQTSADWQRRNFRKVQYNLCACGQPKRKIAKSCQACYRSGQATQINKAGNLWCFTCESYRPPLEFPYAEIPTRKFRHRQCRACDTKARQAYRLRQKVPCVHCGKPALPASEKGKRAYPHPRCRECFVASRVAA